MIYPENFEHKVGFDKIKELVKKKCISDLGTKKIDQVKCSDNLQLIRTLLGEIHEFQIINREESDFPMGHFTDVTSILQKMKVAGNYPEIREVFQLRSVIDSVRSILHFFREGNKEKYPYLKNLCGNCD